MQLIYLALRRIQNGSFYGSLLTTPLTLRDDYEKEASSEYIYLFDTKNSILEYLHNCLQTKYNYNINTKEEYIAAAFHPLIKNNIACYIPDGRIVLHQACLNNLLDLVSKKPNLLNTDFEKSDDDEKSMMEIDDHEEEDKES